jgi:outer membrane protein assembly factor BamA
LNLGYPEASLRSTVTPVPDDPHRVAVTYRIEEGPRVTISQVLYVGGIRSRPDFVERTAGIQARTDLSEGKLLAAGTNLYNTGVFDWADVSPRRPVTTQTEEDVLVRVHEEKRNLLSYGGGFQITPQNGSLSSGVLILPGLPTVGLPPGYTVIQKTKFDPQGSFSYSRLNMRGQGETGSVSALISILDQRGTLSYADRHFRTSNWSAIWSLSAEHTTQNPLYTARVGQASVQFERALDAPKTKRLQLRYTFAQTSLTNLLIQGFVPPEDQSVHLSTLAAAFIRDTRDKPLDAHQGIFQTASFAISPQIFGSSDNVARFFGQTAYYRQVTPWLVWANNFRLGLVWSFAGSHVPFSERYFSGGSDSLRGFPLNGAGPQQEALLCTAADEPSTCTTKVTVPAGGRQLFIFNSEARFPIPLKSGLGGVFFYDGGNVYDAINFSHFFSGYSNTVGFGLRYQTPVGPVRIDVGQNLNPVPGLRRTQWFVTLGQAF